MAEPLPICYLNGEYLPLEEARISPFDRGFLFGDGVYEVMPVYAGRPFRFDAHCERLTRSLAAIRMAGSAQPRQWREHLRNAAAKATAAADQYLYWQVTRGAERGRNHAPLPESPRTVFAFCTPLALPSPRLRERGLACVTRKDTRWARCDIKSIALLANVLLRDLAVQAQADETILLRDGELTEAPHRRVHVVIGGQLRSPAAVHADSAGHHAQRRRRDGRARRHRASRDAHQRGAAARCRRDLDLRRHRAKCCRSRASTAVRSAAALPGPLWRRLYDELQSTSASSQESRGERHAAAEFPTDYPIKVVGRPSAEFRARIHAIVLRHVPALDASHVTERLSENGNYLSISYAIRAESREQMTALAADLKCPDVLLVI